MSVPFEALATEGGDPRLPHYDDAVLAQEQQASVDLSSVTFEEYLYHAALTRAEEKIADEEYRRIRGPTTFMSAIKSRFSKGTEHLAITAEASEKRMPDEATGEKGGDLSNPSGDSVDRYGISPAQYKTASRALRTASWSSIFFLITTDILGPFTVP